MSCFARARARPAAPAPDPRADEVDICGRTFTVSTLRDSLVQRLLAPPDVHLIMGELVELLQRKPRNSLQRITGARERVGNALSVPSVHAQLCDWRAEDARPKGQELMEQKPYTLNRHPALARFATCSSSSRSCSRRIQKNRYPKPETRTDVWDVTPQHTRSYWAYPGDTQNPGTLQASGSGSLRNLQQLFAKLLQKNYGGLLSSPVRLSGCSKTLNPKL
ncbi:hypothetical protein T484DRAFT_1751419 [Baffinella frigidus]|nr:hypothetical protein T484DRAFT_1751419 [Cryptophyta sp. CCMP2293]